MGMLSRWHQSYSASPASSHSVWHWQHLRCMNSCLCCSPRQRPCVTSCALKFFCGLCMLWYMRSSTDCCSCCQENHRNSILTSWSDHPTVQQPIKKYDGSSQASFLFPQMTIGYSPCLFFPYHTRHCLCTHSHKLSACLGTSLVLDAGTHLKR